MQFISVRDLRGQPAQIWKRLKKEKDLVITSNGKPIAILSGIAEDNLEESLSAIRRARAAQAVISMQVKSAQRGLDKMSQREINEEITDYRKRRLR